MDDPEKPEQDPDEPDNLVTPRRRRRDGAPGDEMDHFVKALSHDMNANFMLLESSFKQVKKTCDRHPIKELTAGLAHIDACLKESKRFLDDLILLGTTGSVQMKPQRVPMQTLVAQVLYEQQELIKKRGARVAVSATLPDVWCNETRARQVVTNLIRNAIKHGCDADSPEISISHVAPPRPRQETPDPPSDTHAWFCIHDNGPGIPAAEQEAVFLPGRRLSTASDGTGMGLAIVRKIIEFLGGEALVDPQCQQGTAMLFSLPLMPGETPGQPNVP